MSKVPARREPTVGELIGSAHSLFEEYLTLAIAAQGAFERQDLDALSSALDRRDALAGRIEPVVRSLAGVRGRAESEAHDPEGARMSRAGLASVDGVAREVLDADRRLTEGLSAMRDEVGHALEQTRQLAAVLAAYGERPGASAERVDVRG